MSFLTKILGKKKKKINLQITEVDKEKQESKVEGTSATLPKPTEESVSSKIKEGSELTELEMEKLYKEITDFYSAAKKEKLPELIALELEKAYKKVTDLHSAAQKKGLPELTVLELEKAYKEITDLHSLARLLLEGQKAMEAGNYEQALSAFDRALAIKPDANIYFSRGVIYSLQGLPEKTLEDMDQALELGLDSNNIPHAHKFRGEVHFELDNFPEALEDFSQALLHTPDDFRTLYNKALCYKYMGQLSPAIEGLDQALKYNPRNDQAWFQLCLIYSNLKEHARASESYSQVLTVNSEYAEAYWRRGLERTNLGQNELAIQDFDEFLSR